IKQINNKKNKLPLELQRHKSLLVKTLKKHGVLQAGIFGSYARGEQKKNSDVDILVKTKKGLSLFDFAGIKIVAEEVLGEAVKQISFFFKSRVSRYPLEKYCWNKRYFNPRLLCT